MADLQQIVGAILRDIAQARFSSDIYSREISRYYEQDSLLRRFPVPRTEISEVDLDLKFAVSGVDSDEAGGAGDETSTATVFTKASYRIAQRFFDAASEAARTGAGERPDDEAWTDLAGLLQRTSPRIDLQQDVLEHLERNQGHLVQEGKLDRSALFVSLHELLSGFLDALLSKTGVERAQADPLFQAIEGGAVLREQLDQLAQDVERALDLGGDRRVQVEVTAAYLREVPAEVVSTLHIKAAVQNYMWSEVGEVDGRKWRKLSPE